jgi:hypothetical protein
MFWKTSVAQAMDALDGTFRGGGPDPRASGVIGLGHLTDAGWRCRERGGPLGVEGPHEDRPQARAIDVAVCRTSRGGSPTATPPVTINRAPGLTRWAAVTLGKAMAGLNAPSRACRLGIIEEQTDHDQKREQQRARKPAQPSVVPLLGRQVPLTTTAQGVRATCREQPIGPRGVTRYLQQTFGAAIPDVRAAMETLAKAYPPEHLAAKAFALHGSFHPAIPGATRCWGAAGTLDLDLIRAIAQ